MRNLSRLFGKLILVTALVFSIGFAAAGGKAEELAAPAEEAVSRPDLVVAVQKNPPVLEPMRENSNVHERILYSIAETLIFIDYKENQTIRIRSKQPDFLLEKRFANYMSEIISKKAFLAATDWETWSRNVVGTGPYKLVEIKTGDYIKLEAFDDYWGEKAPARTITFKVVPEVAAQVAGLKTGQYHILRKSLLINSRA